MTMRRGMLFAAVAGLLSWQVPVAWAADNPGPQQADWIAHDFKFHDGSVMPELKLHYATLGDPKGVPVLILHGTGGSGTGLLVPSFAGELFGAGQPLDASKYFVILPDAIGAGKSGKPSDGMRGKFPHYDYADMIQAQYRLLTEGMGIKHLRLVLGYSMGGMETWMWGETYPGFMDALVPMASQPAAMASRNWMLRRMLIQSIVDDPTFQNGNYTVQPPALRLANVFMGIATSGGTLAYQARFGTHAAADTYVDEQLAAPPPTDANDFVYQWGASADYDPEPLLSRIAAPVLAINAADDERNPVETGVMQAAMTHVKNAQLYVIPASTDTRGHGTNMLAKLWSAPLRTFLEAAPAQEK